MKLLLPLSITSKQQLSNALFNNGTMAFFSLRDFEMHLPSQLKCIKRTFKPWLKSSDLLKNSMQHTTNSHTDTFHGQYDVQQ